MIRLLSLFSGIGAFEKALDRQGIEYELVGFSEIDKYAVKSYCAVHGVDESMNLGDITKIDEKSLPKDIDLLTYGFPCTDISVAGKTKGLFNEDGSLTRSGLFFEALRIINETKPRVAIAENVKNLVSKKFKEQFELVLESLEEAGYVNYWKVLNAKDFGIPQNRDRVFIVSIRKDVDNGEFEFPQGFPLKLRLKDMLEETVDEKYYINMDNYEGFVGERRGEDIKTLGYMTGKKGRKEKHQSNTVYSTDGVCPTQYAGQSKDPFRIFDKEPQLMQVGQMYGTEKEPNPQAGRVYSAEGLSPTMDTCSGGNRMPKVIIREATKKGYAEAYEGDGVNIGAINSTTRRGRVGEGGIVNTLTTKAEMGVVVDE